ncbi:MAG: hypothetical protein CMO81_04545 [Waddliaceae bacterium]|nr:hypothetical protein [Waddliaceae bacterium]
MIPAKRLFFLLICLLQAIVCFGQSSIEIQVQKSIIEAGESIQAIIHSTDLKSWSLEELERLIHLDGPGEKKKIQFSLRSKTETDQAEKYLVDIWPQESGYYALYLILDGVLSNIVEVEVQDSENISHDLIKIGLYDLSHATRVHLDAKNRENLQAKEEEIEAEAQYKRDIFNSRNIPWLKIFLYLAVIVIFIAFRRHIWGLWTKLANKTKIAEKARERAKRLLEELKKEKLDERGLYEEFYIRVTQIIRVYIESEYGIRAPEQSTPEFLEAIARDSSFDLNTQEKFQQFLIDADLVKFAKRESNIENCEKMLKSANDLIQ